MNLFGGVISVSGISFLMLCLFGILFAGYALGRITIKGVSLGDAGVFVVALLFGALLYEPLEAQMFIKGGAESVNYLEKDRKSTRLNSSHKRLSRMPSSA